MKLNKNSFIKCYIFLETSTKKSCVIMNAEIPLIRNTYIASIKTLYKQYTVSFEVKPTSFYDINYSYYKSVIHLTIGDDNKMYGDRNPGVWCSPKGILYISSAINNSVDNAYSTNQPLPLLHWSLIKIKQDLVDGLYIYSVVINGTVVYSTTNNNSIELSNVKVYAADPWCPSQTGSIRNLKIISTPDCNYSI